MNGSKFTAEKIYDTYEPYPVSRDSKERPYSERTESVSGINQTKGIQIPDEFPELIGDPMPSDWYYPETNRTTSSPDRGSFRLMQSLFSDRISFLQRALDELEDAKSERQQLTHNAMEDIDSEIQKCRQSLQVLEGMLNEPNRRHQLERRLFELERERRREALLSWKDYIWLKNEIRKLQREIDSFKNTSETTQNRDAPR
jgi:hypothetical protein